MVGSESRRWDVLSSCRSTAAPAVGMTTEENCSTSVARSGNQRVAIHRGAFMAYSSGRVLGLVAGAVALLALPGAPPGDAAWAQAGRTTKIVVPFPPGGGVDVVARVLAEQIGRAQGPAMVIENRPGAGTAIGMDATLRAPP